MSDQYRRNEDDMAYGDYYGQQRGESSGQDRSLLGDTFKKFKSKYDQHQQGQRPPQDFGYGNNPSSSTVGSQQYGNVGGSGYTGGSYQPQQSGQSGQPAYPGGPPQQKPQGKPDLADKVLGGLLGSITSIGHDVQSMIGGSSSQKPNYAQASQQGYQPGLQTNLQTQTASGHTNHRFDSTFAGPKQGNDVKWYVDGCSYMWAVSQALENARQTIWILDWWLSPELYLRRPPARNEEWRIDRVLQRAANRGVKVNIIVYKEVTQVLTLSSSHTKHALEDLSPNIGVLRHPDHLPDAQTAHSSIVSTLQGLKLDASGLSKLGGDAIKGIYGITDDVILYWAHHEKLCLIDGQVAFMGGLDLCYGRWDTNQHPIADAHPSDLNKIVFPGQDYNNARVMDFSEVNHPFQNKLDRTKSSRMGWSDISICLRGPCVGDLIHHFVDRWNFIYDEKYNVRQDKRYARLPDYPEHRKDEGPGPAPVGGQPGQPGQQPQGQQQGHLSSQFAPPPQGAGYTPPAWQGSHTTGGAAAAATGVSAAAAQPYTSQVGQGQPPQGQQYFPPPPPGPAPAGQGMYGQAQTQGYQAPQAHATEQYGQTQPQSQFLPPPGTQQGPSASNQPQQAYSQRPHSPQPPQDQSQYHAGQQQPTYAAPPASAQSGQYTAQQQQSAYPPPPSSAQQGQYGNQPQPQSFYSPTPGGQPASQEQYAANAPIPTVSPLPQQPQQGSSTYQGSQQTTQRPVTPTGPPEAQVAAQQYMAYTTPHDGTHQGPPGSQGPAELGTQHSPPYQPYQGQPTARGFGAEEYEPEYSGHRGFGDEYGGERGSDRASGGASGNSTGRFDRYKEDARKLRTEGKILGHDIGKYGARLENKLDSKVSQYSGGRIGRPTTASGGMSCQLVRSCTKWSNGTATEHSIQNAYIDLIQNSKHFIYIENQFFITATGDNQKPVKNQIGKALVERIIRANREQQPFKIIVNIPSVPAFAGDLVDDAALGTRAIMEFQYFSICRGGHSIMEEVARAGVNPMDYIRFYNLRNYDRINVTPAMQQAQQQSGISYDDARKQYESQLGSGYGGYGEIAAPLGGTLQRGPEQMYNPQQGQQQFGSPPQQGYGSQTGPQQFTQASQQPQQPQQPQQGGYGSQAGQQQFTQPPQQPQQAGYGSQAGQQQFPQTSQQPQQGGYGSQAGQQQFPQTSQQPQQGGYGLQPGQQQFNQPSQQPQGGYGSHSGQQQFTQPPQQPHQAGYGSQIAQQFPPPPQQPQQGGPGPQQAPQAYNQYQQAAQGAAPVKADDWDTVSGCYMLGGQDIRTVPWSGPPESEIDAFVSEELYIHSKVMIIDDQTVICGSANLNDRSMLGTHDSEIALVIQDQHMVQSTMAGRPWQASRFAASLRRQLFRKHLGLLRPQDMQQPDDNFMPIGVPNAYEWGTPEDTIVSDPLSDTFQSLWNSRARTNTEVYRKAFRAVPDDNVKTWAEYKEFYEYYFARADAKAGAKDQQQKLSRVEYGHVVRSDFPGGARELKELLSQVKGTLVEMPLCFLQEEDIAKENMSFNALTAEVYT